MDSIHSIALALGAAWASGINLYASVLVLGLLGATGWISLPVDLQILSNPWVLGVAGVLFLAEFLADKVPGIDSMWDLIHTFIRVPAGALLAVGALGHADPVMQAVALLLGGTLSAASHGSKMSSRLLINASPEPFSNWTASLTEDVLVVSGLYLALHHPLIFLSCLAVFIGAAIWLLPKIFRVIKGGVIRLMHH